MRFIFVTTKPAAARHSMRKWKKWRYSSQLAYCRPPGDDEMALGLT